MSYLSAQEAYAAAVEDMVTARECAERTGSTPDMYNLVLRCRLAELWSERIERGQLPPIKSLPR